MSAPVRESAQVWRRLLFLLGTLLAMLVWPLLGIAAAMSMFEDPSEAAFLFGGFTALLLLPLFFIVDLSDNVYGIIIVILWALTWIAPTMWFTARPRTWPALMAFAAILSSISFAQAALGFLIIIGKEA